jgi:glycosyltransferase involved in cell wall biosynthesis
LSHTNSPAPPLQGIYIAINTFHKVQYYYPNLILNIAGSGSEELNAKQYIDSKGIKNVVFHGFVTGSRKAELFIKNDIFLFPSYREGLPINILEAMYAGLAIITRSVGGIKDFFENGEMGFAIASLDNHSFVDYIKSLINNRALLKKISVFNHDYAKENFVPNLIVGHIDKMIEVNFKS